MPVTKLYQIQPVIISRPHKFIAATKTSSGGISLRITLLEEVAGEVNVRKGRVCTGFYQVNWNIVVRKIE